MATTLFSEMSRSTTAPPRSGSPSVSAKISSIVHGELHGNAAHHASRRRQRSHSTDTDGFPRGLGGLDWNFNFHDCRLFDDHRLFDHLWLGRRTASHEERDDYQD
jgi:hypothetical protein